MSIKGYFTQEGYWGNVNGRWMLFASESDYYDYIKGENHENDT